MRSLLAERIQLHLRNFPDAMSVLRVRRRMSSRCSAADLKAKTEAVAVLLQPLRSRCVVDVVTLTVHAYIFVALALKERIFVWFCF